MIETPWDFPSLTMVEAEVTKMEHHIEMDRNPQVPPSSGRYWWYDPNGWWFWGRLAYAWKTWPALLGWTSPTKRPNREVTGQSDSSGGVPQNRRLI